MTDRIFVWDATKAEANRRKHRLSFEVAARVFLDPFALSRQDRVEGGEQRWQTIGSIDGMLVVLVAHTVEDEDGGEVTRIISARRAERAERRQYEEHRRDTLSS